jgi:transglutaminase-like putative cysteine protease
MARESRGGTVQRNRAFFDELIGGCERWLLTAKERTCIVWGSNCRRSVTLLMRQDPSQRGGASSRSLPACPGLVCIPENQVCEIRDGKTQPRTWSVSRRRLSLITAVILLGAAAYRVGSINADEWLPISPEELKMTSVPEAPGAPAIYLYRQVDRDDSSRTANEYNYVRIKILTEEGRKYADVEIPYVRERGSIINIRARTVHADGTIANFDGKVYDKTIVKARGLKYLAKTFTLPDVQVGSIIEYHYTYDPEEGYVFDSSWILSEELFTLHGKFTLKPNKEFALRWSWPVGLPAGTAPPKDDHGTIRLEAQKIPAFQVEDYMPPENELKYRVEFTYNDSSNTETEPEKFWKKEGRKLDGEVERFVGKKKAMEQAVAQIVSPSDTPEVKLQKIYAKVQTLRNTSYEVEKTEQEKKREKEKEVTNVEELWKRGYGNGTQLTWLFLGLARAAGLEAYPVIASARNVYFFKASIMNPSQLDTNLVLVKLNGQDIYCDPGTKFVPYGMLPWEETAVQGLRLDKDGGSWVTTTLPESSVSRIERKAALKLDDTGSLEGKLTITFTGLEALSRRQEERNVDEADRKKFLEDQVREYIPVGIDVELTNKPDWSSSAEKLVAEYDLKVPGSVSGAGRRALLPAALFCATEKQLFELSNRVHPIYFQFPFQKIDDVTIELPLGWQVSSVPPVKNQDAKAVVYTLKVDNDKGTLHLSRMLNVDLLLVDTKSYPTLRSIFQIVRAGDEQQVVLEPVGATARN